MTGTSAEISGAVGSKGFRGSTLPSTTGPRRTLPHSIEQFLSQEFLQGVGLARLQSEALENFLSVFLRFFASQLFESRTALHDSLVEQSFGRRHRQQGTDFSAAAGLAEDRHISGISSKVGDVVADPLQRSDKIEHAQITEPAYFAPPASSRYK